MSERFTERARLTVQLAQQRARGLGHGYIGTEHILLGLLAEADGVAGRVLADLGMTLEGATASVESIVGIGADAHERQTPFTPRSRTVYDLAAREALSLGHNYIGTEHILLGLVRENEGVGARILREALGDDAGTLVRDAIIRALKGPPRKPAPVTANTRECFTTFTGQRLIGVLFDALPRNRRDIATGTRTLVFEDGRGLTIEGHAHWVEKADDIQAAVDDLAAKLDAARSELAELLRLAGKVVE